MIVSFQQLLSSQEKRKNDAELTAISKTTTTGSEIGDPGMDFSIIDCLYPNVA